MGRIFRDTTAGKLLAAALVAGLVGCGVEAGPTPLAPVADDRVEVVYENQADEVHIVSIVGEAPDEQGFALAEPCSRSNMIVVADPPFEIGVGEGSDMEPQTTLLHSDDLDQPADGLYRVFVRIDAQGEVTVGALVGSQEFGPADIC